MKPQERNPLFAAAVVALSVGTLAYASPAVRIPPRPMCDNATTTPAIGAMDIAWREPLR